MPVKIIHHTEDDNNDNVSQEQKLNLNIENCLQQMFNICQKVVNYSQKLLDNCDIENLLQIIDNNGELELHIERIKQLTDLFSIIFGKKFSIIESLTKTTAIMQKIQVLAEKFGVELIQQQENDNVETFSEEDIEVLKQLVEDFGIEQIKQDMEDCNKEIMEKQNQQKKDIPKKTEVYDVYKDNE